MKEPNYSSKGSDKFPISNSVNTSNVNRTSEIQFYNHPLFGQIRTVMVNDEPYFVGNDIATSLGYAKPRNAITQHVENEDALKWGIPDNQGLIQETTIINESGMYSLVFGSKLPTAKDFKHWVTKEVLPTIRKTGSYSLQHPKVPQTYLAALKALVVSEEEKEQLQLENSNLKEERQKIEEETKPAVVFTESVKISSTNILMRDLAKIITQNGYEIGQDRLYDWMVENNFLIRDRRWSKSQNKYVNVYTPTQVAAKKKLFWVSERPINNPGQQPFIKYTCYVTGEGQVYFINKFNKLIAA